MKQKLQYVYLQIWVYIICRDYESVWSVDTHYITLMTDINAYFVTRTLLIGDVFVCFQRVIQLKSHVGIQLQKLILNMSIFNTFKMD